MRRVRAPAPGGAIPEARWRLTPAELEKLGALQARLLELAATLVKPGGHLTYVVCSLLDEEGAGQFARFLEEHPEWRAVPAAVPLGTPHGPGMRLTPSGHGTDGFFIARAALA